MLNKQNTNEVKERKSLKEMVVENKGKILVGAGIVTVGVLAYMGYKNNENIKTVKAVLNDQFKLNTAQGELNAAVSDITGK